MSHTETVYQAIKTVTHNKPTADMADIREITGLSYEEANEALRQLYQVNKINISANTPKITGQESTDEPIGFDGITAN